MSVVDHDPDEQTLVVDRRTGTLGAGGAVLDAPGRRRDDFPPDELALRPSIPPAAPVQTERLSAFRAVRKFLAFVIVGTLVGLSASAVATRVLGYEGLSVLSGSMAPSIRTGDVIINNRIRPMEARVGNIITFKDPQSQKRLITHRIQAIEHRGKSVYFETKGDANNTVENWRVDERDELGRAIAHVPRMGFALGWLGTPVGRIGFIIVPAVLLGFLELIRIWRAPSPSTDEPEISSVEPPVTTDAVEGPIQLVLEPQTAEVAAVESATNEIAAVEPATSEVAAVESATTEIAALDLAAVEAIRPGDVAWFVSPVVEIAPTASEAVTTVIDVVLAEPVAAPAAVEVEVEVAVEPEPTVEPGPAVERPRRPMSTPVRRTPPKRGSAAAARARRARIAHEAARSARAALRAAQAAAAAAAAEVEAAAAAALAAQPAAADIVAEALAASAVAAPVATPVAPAAPAPTPAAGVPVHGIPVPPKSATAAVPALVGLAVIGILSARRKRGR